MAISIFRKRAITHTATRLLTRSGAQLTQQIDVFTLIRDSNVVLRFMELDRLLGAFVPGANPGIIVNSRLPSDLQRYTAAHELGHFVLHSEAFALDGTSEVEGRTPDNLEAEAQLFASHLLMPLPLVSRAARDVGIRKEVAPTADQIYAIAGIMGVSYSASLVQLRNFGIVSYRHGLGLQDTRPVSVQVQRTFGERIADPGTHVWSRDEVAAGKLNDLYVGDLVAVDLPENRTTGFRWFLGGIDAGGGDSLVELDGPQSLTALDRFQFGDRAAGEITQAGPTGAVAGPVVGSGGRRQMLIRANTEGEWKVTLSYAPVHRQGSPVDSVVLEGRLHLRPSQEQRRVLLENYRKLAEGGERA